MRKYLIALLLVLMVAIGCAEPINKGLVLKHRYIPESESFILSGDVLIPITDPEEWQVFVQEYGTSRQKWVSVTKEQYERLKEGDTYERR